MSNNKTQVDYTAYGTGYQLCLAFDPAIKIPENDEVRLLDAVVEEMDIRALTATYEDRGRNEYSPRALLKICVYGYMRKIYSSRELEKACQENIKFMYLIRNGDAPDHNTIARFRSQHLDKVKDILMRELAGKLMECGALSLEKSAVFIDGTKIESVGNRYQFVWKKSTIKYKAKLENRIKEELPELIKEAGMDYHLGEEVVLHKLKKLLKKVKVLKSKTEETTGKVQKRSAVNKLLNKLTQWISKLKEYQRKLYLCGERNSYCKTDPEATFMRMKEDHMKNGQLKPGYNVNVASASGFVIGTYVSSDRTDYATFIPFLEKLSSNYKQLNKVVVDSGYEREENYRYADEHPQIDLYVKPSNYEQKKHKKYRNDISRRENMQYDAEKDAYICAEGKRIEFTGTRNVRLDSGRISVRTLYACSGCKDCPRKAECIKSKSEMPLEERVKRLEVSKYFIEKRAEMEAKIITEEGKKLRMNRSIQAEGVFGYIKTDLAFRRFMLKGMEKVGAEWFLLSFAYNILKLHHKAQTGQLGTHMYDLKAS